MKSKMLLVFLLVAVSNCVFGMNDHYAPLVHSGLNLQKSKHANSLFGVINQTTFDSQYPDALKRGYNFHHSYEEWVWVNNRLIKITNSYRTNQKNKGLKLLLCPAASSSKSVLLRMTSQSSSLSSCNQGSELDCGSSFETVD